MNLYLFFQMVINMSFMGSVVAGLIFLIKALFKNRFNAAFHYYIWFLLIIRLIIPYAPETSFSIFNFIPFSSGNIEGFMELQENRDYNSVYLAAGDEESHQGASNRTEGPYKNPVNGGILRESLNKYFKSAFWISSMQYIWLVGVLNVILYNLGIYFTLLHRTRNIPKCAESEIMAILNYCKNRVKTTRMPDIVYCPEVKVPSLLAYFKPRILLPPDIAEKLSPEELEYVFLHEMMHLKRRDILTNWLTVVIQALHWFNPVVWHAFQMMRKDREIACDAQVLACLEPEKRKNYGYTIISLLEILSKPYWNPGVIGIATKKSEFKRRIIMIKKFSKTSFKWTITTVAAIILVGAIALTNAKGLAKTPPTTENNNELHQEEQGGKEEVKDFVDNEASNAENHNDIEDDTINSFPQMPQILLEVNGEIVESDQKQVDEGHSPWQLSPFAVAQTFVGLQISPEGIQGDFPVDVEELEIVFETNEGIIVEVSGDKTPVSRVYLKRLVKQNEDGIWTVVGYDPISK